METLHQRLAQKHPHIILMTLLMLLILLPGISSAAPSRALAAPALTDLVCDDGDNCYSYNGYWNPPSNPNQYCKYGGDMRFGYACYTNPDCRPDNDHFSTFWRPAQVAGFTPGYYQVSAYISRVNSATPHTQSAKYYLRRDGDSAASAPLMATVNQAHPYQDNDSCADDNRWAPLGTHYFNAETYVELRAWTDESAPQWGSPHHVIFADALRLVYVGPDTTPPTGALTAPSDGARIGPGTVNLTADASDTGSGVDRVEFYARYDGGWYAIGTDNTAPYGIGWTTPAGLTSQLIVFAIHVVDRAGNTAIDPGGYRTVTFASEPAGNERTIPIGIRYYFNQRSLPDGSVKCGVSSIAMVLAMNGSIGGDYTSMRNEAERMWNQEGVRYPGIYTVANALRRRGYTATAYGQNVNRNWELLKQEINAGRPVIVNSPPGAMTPGGHYIVVVGYKEHSDPNQRRVYVYDPFGRHSDCYPASHCTWNQRWPAINNTTPNSSIGRWVNYPWASMQPQLVIARRNKGFGDFFSMLPLADFEPELISNETPSTDVDEPAGGGLEQVFVPLMLRY